MMFPETVKPVKIFLYTCLALVLFYLLILLSAALTAGLLNLAQYMGGPIGTFLTDKGPARIMRRVLLIGIIIIIVFSLKKFGWRGWKDCGWTRSDDETSSRWAQFGWGAALGFISLGGIALLTIFTGLHQLKSFKEHYPALIGNVFFFCLSGIAVALIEETICRGILFRVFARIWRAWPAAIIISVLFAAAHFIGSDNAVFQDSSFISIVFNVSVATIKSIVPPPDSLVHFLNLTLLGILLCTFVMRTKTIWMSVGAHAVWVFIIKLHSYFTDFNLAAGQSIWLGKRNDFMDSHAVTLLFAVLIFLTLGGRKKAGVPAKVSGNLWHILPSGTMPLGNFLKAGEDLFLDGKILKAYPGCRVTASDGLVLKKYSPKSLLDGLRFAFHPLKTRRAFLLAEALIGHGVPTPSILAWSASRRLGLLMSEAMIVSEVKNAEPLTDWLATRDAWLTSNPVNTDESLKVKHPAASRGATCSAGVALATQVESLRNPAKPGTPFFSMAASHAVVTLAMEDKESQKAFWRRRVMEAYGNLMAAFHRRGYSNRDLKHENVMCSKTDPTLLQVVDLDGVRHHLFISRRRAGRDLMRIGKSLASLGWTNEKEIAAFFDAYNCQLPPRLHRRSFPE